MAFLIFEDNGGSYRWKIRARDGATLRQPGDFASSTTRDKPRSRSVTVPRRRASNVADVR
jgi:hypothetical protein